MYKIRNNIFETNSSSVHAICFDNKSFLKDQIILDKNGVLKIVLKNYTETYDVLKDFQDKINYMFSLAIYNLLTGDCFINGRNLIDYYNYDFESKEINNIVKLIENYVNSDLNKTYIENKKYFINITEEFIEFIKSIRVITNCKGFKITGIPDVTCESSFETPFEFLNEYNCTLNDLLTNRGIIIIPNSWCGDIDEYQEYTAQNSTQVTELNELLKDAKITENTIIYDGIYFAILDGDFGSFVNYISLKFNFVPSVNFNRRLGFYLGKMCQNGLDKLE